MANNKACILPTHCICVFFVCISKQTAIMSLRNINRDVDCLLRGAN